jgi:hypothetical protein
MYKLNSDENDNYDYTLLNGAFGRKSGAERG